MLNLLNLSRRVGDKTLLDRVSLSIDAGDAIGLVGPSGSGKSTLMRAIAMLDPLNEGAIEFAGQPIIGNTVPGYRLKVVYLGQRPTMLDANVEDNLRLPFSFAQVAKTGLSFDRDEAVSWLAKYGLPADVMRQNAMTLSGGQRQAIAMLRAILVDPSVILLDEPTASLDEDSIAKFEKLAKAWKDDKPARAWVWTSHDRDQVTRMTDRTISMNSGRIIS
ncbi:ATP-binding cassette domain-containing protein [Rubripirellula amarantea]|nr:ATP-binding cassette domain-containing protein [Rubripirellula amarantea]